MSAFLSRDDVKRLTKRTRFSAQRRVLDAKGIRYVAAPDGEPIVRAEWVEANGQSAKTGGHRWDRIGAIHAFTPEATRARR